MSLSDADRRFLDINRDLMLVLVKHADPVGGLRALKIGTVTGAIQAGVTREEFIRDMGAMYDRLLADSQRSTVGS